MAEKFYINHRLFKQTHDHTLIQYAHEMIIYFMGFLHRKKAFFSMFILDYKSLFLQENKFSLTDDRKATISPKQSWKI